MTSYLIESQQNSRELYRLGLESVPFLLAVGDLLIGWLLLRQAEIALNALDGDVSERDRAFYAGKVAAREVLRPHRAAAAVRAAPRPAGGGPDRDGAV